MWNEEAPGSIAVGDQSSALYFGGRTDEADPRKAVMATAAQRYRFSCRACLPYGNKRGAR